MTTAAQAPGIASIGQIAINVQDLQRALAFYRDKLGLNFLYEFPGLAFFDCGGVRLMMSRAEKLELDHPASIIYYKVANIRAASSALEEGGVNLEHQPTRIAEMPDHDLWMSFARDTEGNLFGLMSEVAKPAK